MAFPLNELIEIYREKCNEDNAISMKSYMKDRFEFLGIRSPERKALRLAFFKKYAKPSHEELHHIIGQLYNQSEREFHYLAIEIASFFKKKWLVSDIEIIEMMMHQNQWWDTIDFVASHLVGSYCQKFPDYKNELNERYIESENFWIRRVAILFQLKYKDQMDEDILSKNILFCAHEKEFFIEKAIGWILREYSKTNAEWVSHFINENELRPLSKREGSKYL